MHFTITGALQKVAAEFVAYAYERCAGGYRMNRLKVWCIYAFYSVLFVLAFAVMLALITTALVCIPAGFFFALVGGAMLCFDTSFVLTALAPEIMLFGGLFIAAFTAFLGFVAVKLGFAEAKLFCVLRRYCDRLRGWCT